MLIVYGIFDAMMMMIRSINWEIACIACMSVNYIIWVKPAFSMLDQQNIFPHIYTLEFHTFFALKYTIYVLNSIHGSLWTIVYRHWPVYSMYRQYFTLHFFSLANSVWSNWLPFYTISFHFSFCLMSLNEPNADTDTHTRAHVMHVIWKRERDAQLDRTFYFWHIW